VRSRRLLVYVDSSVIGGCEDEEFKADSLALWRRFIEGRYTLALSAHTMRELEGAPDAVSAHLDEVPDVYQLLLPDSEETSEFAVEPETCVNFPC